MLRYPAPQFTFVIEMEDQGMNDTDQGIEEIPSSEVSDEALEGAGMVPGVHFGRWTFSGPPYSYGPHDNTCHAC